MFEKQKEIQLLCDRLQRTEMELATLKLERLCTGTHHTIIQSICTETVEYVVGGASVTNQVHVLGNSRVNSNIQPQLGEYEHYFIWSLPYQQACQFCWSITMTGTVVNIALIAPSGNNQSQCHCTPIDEFTGEDS